MTAKTREKMEVTWQDLLRKAVHEPGLIHEGYSRFHNYSIGNQLLAMWQCAERDIEPGPISTYNGWKALGRQVKHGEKAIVLWQPLSGKKREVDEKTGEENIKPFLYFALNARWFVLGQTDGPEIEWPELPEWKIDHALESLGIKQVPFEMLNGNPQGYANEGEIAINPMAVMPMKTAIHEIAHNVLGHVSGGGRIVDGEKLARNVREVEAESVAMIVCDALELPGQEYSRGYIQNWWQSGEEIPEPTARRIFSAANKIIQAGRNGKDEEGKDNGI